MTLSLGHVGFAGVYVQFLESCDVRSKRTTYAKLVSKLVRNSARTLLMYILGSIPGLRAILVEKQTHSTAEPRRRAMLPPTPRKYHSCTQTPSLRAFERDFKIPDSTIFRHRNSFNLSSTRFAERIWELAFRCGQPEFQEKRTLIERYYRF
jgi:hypothetical protein